MAWFNEEISGLLREYAELTQITGGDVFRARNYEKAARSGKSQAAGWRCWPRWPAGSRPG